MIAGCGRLHQVVVTLPIDVQQAGNRAETRFDLSKGRYLLAIHRVGPADNTQDEKQVGRIWYQLEVPERAVELLGETDLNFNLGIAEIRVKDFSLDQSGKGRLRIVVLKSSGTPCQAAIIKNPFP